MLSAIRISVNVTIGKPIVDAVILEPIKPHQIEAAKQLIEAVWLELLGDDPSEEVRAYPHTRLTDLDDIDEKYFARRGLFMVATCDAQIVGTGAIGYLSEQVCELKRMFLLPAYRQQGNGFRLASYLLQSARDLGYNEVRLGTNKKFIAAQRVYGKLGFHDDLGRIDPYGRTIYMKLLL